MWSVAKTPVSVALVCLVTALPSFGGPDIKVSQDPNLSQVENEPSITINKHFGSDLLNVVAAYNDIGNSLGVSWSADSGKTWTDVQLPAVYATTGDPSIVSDHNGNLYACFLSFSGTTFYGSSGIFVCKSIDGGRNWSAAVPVDNLVYSSTPVPFADKCQMTVDTFSVSPYRGNIYVGWQRDNINGQNSDVYFARSTNGGASFLTPQKINDAPLGTTFSEGAFPFVGADGDVYMTWYDCYFKGHVPGSLYVDKSTDGGVTFGTDVQVSNLTAPPLFTGANTNFRAKVFPSAAADPNDSERLYITYISDPDGYFDRRIDVGNTPGTTPSDYPDICRNGNWVYTVWQDGRAGGGNYDIFFNRSSDGGQTWLLNATGPLDNTVAPASSNSQYPKIATSGNNVYIVWEDYRYGGGTGAIFFNRSLDNGQTWQTEQDLDKDPTWPSERPVIAAIGNYVYVAWQDLRSGQYDIYFTYSSNNGASWNPPTRVDLGDGAGNTISNFPRLACTGNYVYCLWRDGRTAYTRPYFNYSSNNGATWQATSVNLSTVVGSFSSDLPYRGGIECTGTHVYATWIDNRSGTFQVFFNASHDNGATWGNERAVSSPPVAGVDCQYHSMAYSGNYVYVGWADDRTMMGSPVHDCYFDYSSDNGSTWHSTDIGPLNPSHSGKGAFWMNLQTDGNYVYATWLGNDPLPGMMRGNIYFARSSNNGQTWSSDVKLSYGTFQPMPIPWQCIPAIAAGNNWVNVLWPDPRFTGMPDIYTNYSSDNGATWLAGLDESDVYLVRSVDGGASWSSPVTVNDDGTTNPQVLPWVVVKGNSFVDVTYYDFVPSPPGLGGQVRLGVSTDRGVSFMPTQAIQDVPVPAQTQWVGEYNGMAVLDDMVYTVFTDLAHTTSSDIFLDRTFNPTPDADGDGLSDLEEASIGSNPNDDDSDHDGVDDYTEVFALGGSVSNPADTDGDLIPNVLDPDDDGDGINTIDEDTDGDGDPTNDDIDGDLKPNYLDLDSDDDTYNDGVDNCPWVSNPGQEDSDSDGIGDACDNGSCCVGRVGNANMEGDYPDEVTLGDIMLMVDVKFISGDCSKLSCLTEADVNQDGGANPNCDDHITLGDIMALVDFLFITGPETAVLNDCL
jgi:hypothetical protein